MTPRRYLIVDDNAELADNLAEILTCSDSEAVTTNEPLAALELVGTKRFDALITDLRMPSIDGPELVRRARQVDPGLPMVAVTAFATHRSVSELEAAGVLGVLTKPLPMAKLLDLVRRARRDATVLVVEDDAALGDNLSELLRSRGVSVSRARDIAELERALDGPPTTLALVDLKLPGAEVGRSLAMLKSRWPRVPRLLTTAFASTLSPDQTDAVFEKPFESSALLAQVEVLLETRDRP